MTQTRTDVRHAIWAQDLSIETASALPMQFAGGGHVGIKLSKLFSAIAKSFEVVGHGLAVKLEPYDVKAWLKLLGSAALAVAALRELIYTKTQSNTISLLCCTRIGRRTRPAFFWRA